MKRINTKTVSVMLKVKDKLSNISLSFLQKYIPPKEETEQILRTLFRRFSWGKTFFRTFSKIINQSVINRHPLPGAARCKIKLMVHAAVYKSTRQASQETDNGQCTKRLFIRKSVVIFLIVLPPPHMASVYSTRS